VAIAAQVAAIGRLGLQLPKAGRGVVPLFYDSFTCPCRFLAGLRVDRLIGVEWRAVVHDPTAPPNGQQVPGELADFVDCGSAWVSKS
jgi:hypothetical protein